jgi:hypothetical protein
MIVSEALSAIDVLMLAMHGVMVRSTVVAQGAVPEQEAWADSTAEHGDRAA